MNKSVTFYDEYVEENINLDVIDIEEISLIDGEMFIFNVDGICFKTKNIKFK